MNTWIGQTFSADLSAGGRFYVMERMYSPGSHRPSYAVGDEFRVAQGNGPEIPGRISAVQGASFDVEVGETTLRFSPTPPGSPPPSLQSDIPFEDFIAVPM